VCSEEGGAGLSATSIYVAVMFAAVISVLVAWHMKYRYYKLICILAAYIVLVTSILHFYAPNLSAEAWLAALAGLVLVFYTYFTYGIARDSARDLEMRTRPVVTALLSRIAFESVDPTDEITGLNKLRLSTHIKNHSATHGYAKVSIEFYSRREDNDGPEKVYSIPEGDYSGESIWTIAARGSLGTRRWNLPTKMISNRQ
jgi:signal transduction histidine kinase